MSFGQNIKRLRRDADMTQEQLAEMLSISPQAISRWETDSAMPDISLLPLLVNIFGVTSDELLEINVERNNEKISDILATEEQARYNGDFEKSADILRDAYRQYPRSFAIMERLAHALINVYSRQGRKDYDEVICLCNKILDNCTDSMIRYKALESLGTAYDYAGKKDDMKRIADQMPPFCFCKEAFMIWRDELNEETLLKRKEYLIALLDDMLSTLLLIVSHRYKDGSMIYSTTDRISILKQLVGIIELLYPDGDYQYKAQFASNACDMLARIYLGMGQKDDALYWLERKCKYDIHFDTYDFNSSHTSPAFRGYADGGWIMEKEGNCSAQFLKICDQDVLFGDIRSDERFERIISQLKQIAKKT